MTKLMMMGDVLTLAHFLDTLLPVVSHKTGCNEHESRSMGDNKKVRR